MTKSIPARVGEDPEDRNRSPGTPPQDGCYEATVTGDRDKIIEISGKTNENANCKRLSYSPADAIQSATPSSCSKKRDRQKRVAKANS